MVRQKLDVEIELTDQEAVDLAFLDLLEATFYAHDEVYMGNQFMFAKAVACVQAVSHFPQMNDDSQMNELVTAALTTPNADTHEWMKELLAG